MVRFILCLTLLFFVLVVSSCSTHGVRKNTLKSNPSVEFQEAIHEQIVPKLDKLSNEEVLSHINELASAILVSRKAELHRLARKILLEMPQFDAELDEYNEVLDVERQRDFSERLHSELGLIKKGQAEDYVVILLAEGFWDPSKAALGWRKWVLSRMISFEQMNKRGLVEQVAQPRVQVADCNLEKPTMAIVFGPELFMISLEYIEDSGVYLPTELQWLSRQP